jgi:hypothetical protein
MEIVARPRGGGKTALLIDRLRQYPTAIMVVGSHNEKERIERQYPDLKGRLYTLDEYPVRSRGRVSYDTPIFIDNLDDFLSRFFAPGHVHTATFTEDTIPQRETLRHALIEAALAYYQMAEDGNMPERAMREAFHTLWLAIKALGEEKSNDGR